MKTLSVFLFAAALSAQTVKPALTEDQKDDVAFNSSIAYCQKNPSGTAWLYGTKYIHGWYSDSCSEFLKQVKPVIDIRAANAKSRRAQTVSTEPGCANYAKGDKHLPNVPACKQAVKPTLPVAKLETKAIYPENVWWTDSITGNLYAPPCGYEYFTATKDANGVCSMTANFHFGPDYADCRFVSTEDGKVLQIVCTWTPKETK